ncbi:MAG: hypothetical protein WCG26_02380 [Chloroflexales bacterium]
MRHFDASSAGPRAAWHRSWNGKTIANKLIQPHLTGIALSNRIRRNQAKLPILAQRVARS